MNPPPQQTLYIAIITAILAGIMVLLRFRAILDHLIGILSEYRQYWHLRNERQREENEERRVRIAMWMAYIQKGQAKDRLIELDKSILNNRERKR